MRRNWNVSQILFPGLLILALTLFLIPEAQVDSLRGQALSALSPILRRCVGFRHIPPSEAIITVKLEPVKNAETENLKSAPDDYECVIKDRDELRDALARALCEINRLKGSVAALDLPPSVAARIILRKVLWEEPLLGLDRGEAEGVRLHAGVLHRGAVVGRIVSVGSHASSLALLTHRGLCITARLAECRIEGVLRGLKADGDERLCRMAVVGRECNAKIGEHVVTSGLDGAFPPGLWLGTVTAVEKNGDMQWSVTTRPACVENAIETVQVLTDKPPEVPWPIMPKGRR
ncbi:MAG: rod shape-determining protein MreC [Planctomycetota bacterium]